jgi:hypothetical protein
MNFSVANHNSQYIATGFIHYDNVEFKDIPEMIMSGYAYASAKFTNNHRHLDNYEGQEDVLILDVDDKVTLEQAKCIFKKYTNFIITSRNHQKEKNGFVCDRYRVFIKLAETLSDTEVRVDFIASLFDNFPFVDQSCKDSSRYYFASPEGAEVFYNEGKDMPIIKTKLPELDEKRKTLTNPDDYTPKGIYVFSELTEKWTNEFGEVLEGEGKEFGRDAIEKGARAIFDEEFVKGNANHCIFKVACMLLKDGFNEDDMANFIIAEVSERSKYPFNKTMAAIKSAIKTV